VNNFAVGNIIVKTFDQRDQKPVNLPAAGVGRRRRTNMTEQFFKTASARST